MPVFDDFSLSSLFGKRICNGGLAIARFHMLLPSLQLFSCSATSIIISPRIHKTYYIRCLVYCTSLCCRFLNQLFLVRLIWKTLMQWWLSHRAFSHVTTVASAIQLFRYEHNYRHAFTKPTIYDASYIAIVCVAGF